jgi:hypothetical protein
MSVSNATVIRRRFGDAVDDYAYVKDYYDQLHTTAQLSTVNRLKREYESRRDLESFFTYAEALNVVGFHTEAKRLTSIKMRENLLGRPGEAYRLFKFSRGLKVE